VKKKHNKRTREMGLTTTKEGSFPFFPFSSLSSFLLLTSPFIGLSNNNNRRPWLPSPTLLKLGTFNKCPIINKQKTKAKKATPCNHQHFVVVATMTVIATKDKGKEGLPFVQINAKCGAFSLI
jgi:hypothetical protein